MMRSFKRVNPRGRKPSGGDSCSPDACGANSQGPMTSRPVNINRDQSSGMQRPNSPRASKQ